MKEENLESKVKEMPPVVYSKIISDRVARVERYKIKVLYAGIAAAMAAGTVSGVLYYFMTQ